MLVLVLVLVRRSKVGAVCRRANVSCNGVRVQVGESGKSTRDLERTIALLKKAVERTQAENERLKKTPGVLLATSELGPLRAENETLRGELDELRAQAGAKLVDRYNATQQGTRRPLTTRTLYTYTLRQRRPLNTHTRSDIALTFSAPHDEYCTRSLYACQLLR